MHQEPEELKAFIYNLYYDPLVRLLYDMWGKYLGETAPAEVGTAAAAQPAAAAAVASVSATGH